MVISEHLELPSDVVERRRCRNKGGGEKRIKQINKMKRKGKMNNKPANITLYYLA